MPIQDKEQVHDWGGALKINQSLAALGLCCCLQAFASYGEWGLLLFVCSGFAWWSTGLSGHRLSSYGIWALASPTAHGILPDQGSNLCLLHWQVDSYQP